MVPKIGSRHSDGPISRFGICGEDVGRSFVVCSHDPIFRTGKETSIWRPNDHRDIMQNLSAPFICPEDCPMDRACSISIRFFKIKDPCVGRSFSMCSHDPIFGTNKNRILKDGSCERAFRLETLSTLNSRNCLGQELKRGFLACRVLLYFKVKDNRRLRKRWRTRGPGGALQLHLYGGGVATGLEN